jgi:hypothetical protein
MKVKALKPIRHNHKRYEIGEELEINEKELDHLKNDVEVVKAKTPKKGDENVGTK